MAIASLAASGAGAGMNIVGSYFGAKSAKAQGMFNAKMARINAKMADADARAALGRGERAEQASRLDTAQLKSQQRVGYAANGVDLSSGTAVDTLTSTDVMGEVDANTIKANALREAWGHRTQAVSYRSSANMSEATASAINPLMETLPSLLTGASQVASSYSSFKRSGALQDSNDAWARRKTSFMAGLKGL